jgi:cellulose synthase/poly-beta-1,6-N-acetylglucosamine synthase-like glycosyltransferase
LLIAAFNEEEAIEQKMNNSLELDYPKSRLHILVVADGSVDKTCDIVRSYEDRGIELIYHKKRLGKMAAITSAIPMVRGEIIVFSDANNLYDSNTVRELVKHFNVPDVGVVSGAKSIIEDESSLSKSEGLYWKYESFIKQQETRFNCCVSVAGEILAIRKELFESPPDKVINDDFYIAMQIARQGYQIVYEPEARSYEKVSKTAPDEIIRRSRIIAGRYQAIAFIHKLLTLRRPVLAWQVISHKFLRPLVPFAMIGMVLANIMLILFPVYESANVNALFGLKVPYNWMLLAAQAVFYGAAWYGSRIDKKGALGKALYLPAFLVNSNYAALVGLYRFLTGRQSVLWDRVQRKN